MQKPLLFISLLSVTIMAVLSVVMLGMKPPSKPQETTVVQEPTQPEKKALAQNPTDNDGQKSNSSLGNKNQQKPVKRHIPTPQNIDWHTDYNKAFKEAKKSGKLVFVDFYTDWCSACKYLDSTTYRDTEFLQFSTNWVMVKVNAEKGASNQQFAKKYQVHVFPTMMMFDTRGQKLNQIEGTYPPGMMMSEMHKAEKKLGILSAQIIVPPTVG